MENVSSLVTQIRRAGVCQVTSCARRSATIAMVTRQPEPLKAPARHQLVLGARKWVHVHTWEWCWGTRRGRGKNPVHGFRRSEFKLQLCHLLTMRRQSGHCASIVSLHLSVKWKKNDSCPVHYKDGVEMIYEKGLWKWQNTEGMKRMNTVELIS